MRASFHFSVLVTVLWIALGCDCFRDVANVPQAGFLRLVHKAYKTKREVFLVSDNFGKNKDSIVVPGEHETAASIAEYRGHPEKWSNIRQGHHIAAVLPAGTVIRFDSLIAEVCESGGQIPFATVLNGKYAGDQCSVSTLLNDPYGTHEPEWTPNSAYIEPN